MHTAVKYLVLLVALAIGNIFYKGYKRNEPIQLPPEAWWGLGDEPHEDTKIVPFQVKVPNEVIEDLKHRLGIARNFTPPLEGIQQQYGINTNLLQKFLIFWKNKYDFNQRVSFLNFYKQYKTNIQGLDIHYIHQKPKNTSVTVLPLLLLHGWPGSVREFYEMIPTLVAPKNGIVFEVIAPSLPGFGFSQGTTKPGLGIDATAVILKNLMKRLGFDSFYVHGGDFGASIGQVMAYFYPEKVQGLHSTMCMSNSLTSKFKILAGSLWPSLAVEDKYKDKLYPLSAYFSDVLLETGYFHIQTTKPDTVGIGLNDSPAGLAAYILEKFITWTNADWKQREDGGLQIAYTYTKLLDNIMIYWVTHSITTSMRFYAESLGIKGSSLNTMEQVQVPTICTVLERDVNFKPRVTFEDGFAKLLQVNYIDAGHFAALERPELLGQEILAAVLEIENFRKNN